MLMPFCHTFHQNFVAVVVVVIVVVVVAAVSECSCVDSGFSNVE